MIILKKQERMKLYRMSHNKVYPIERIISCLTYITLGWAGVIILIIQAITKKQPTQFVMYHILQSIFLCFGYFVLSEICYLLVVLIARIPVINMIPILLNMPLSALNGFSFIQAVCYTVIIYLALTSLMGKYSFLPWVSNIIIYWIKR